tara:strand:+ start:98 stop:619 length:522 start_codon:yes stop_codon:yes gene_type:complete
MIKEIYKKSLPVVFSLLALTGCNKESLENNILGMKQFLKVSTQNLAEDLKPKYDDSMLNKWYKIQDKKDFAERMLGSSNYETYDIVVPFPGGKWTRTSSVPIIEELYRSYIGFKESWPEKKKEAHLKHYNQYLEDFLKRMGKDADIDENDVLSLEELEGLKEYRLYLNSVVDI